MDNIPLLQLKEGKDYVFRPTKWWHFLLCVGDIFLIGDAKNFYEYLEKLGMNPQIKMGENGCEQCGIQKGELMTWHTSKCDWNSVETDEVGGGNRSNFIYI